MQAGEARRPDVQTKAQLVHAFVIGLLLRAKIYNDLKILRQLWRRAFLRLIGAPERGVPG
jgi:hypothetical protein